MLAEQFENVDGDTLFVERIDILLAKRQVPVEPYDDPEQEAARRADIAYNVECARALRAFVSLARSGTVKITVTSAQPWPRFLVAQQRFVEVLPAAEE